MTLQLGDRVSVTGHQDCMNFCEDTGVIIRLDSLIGVEFDDPSLIEARNGGREGDTLHSSQDLGRYGRCWNFDRSGRYDYNTAVVSLAGARVRKKSGFGQFVEKHSL